VKILYKTIDTIFVGENPHADYSIEPEEQPPPRSISGSANVPDQILDSIPSERISSSGTRVTYSAKVRRMTLQRYITSKIAFFPERVTTGELLVLYDNLLWCQDKSLKDPHFKQKFGSSLEELALILKRVRFEKTNIPVTVRNLSIVFKSRLDGFLIPVRNLPGVEVHVRGSYHILPTSSLGTPTKELPLKRYIGVGYKDKGHRRDPAWDGSPSWQEVAVKLGDLE